MSDTTASDGLREELLAYIERYKGVQNAAIQLGLSKEAVSRAAAGLTVRAGTLAQIREKLKRR